MPLAEYQSLVDSLVRDDAGKISVLDRDTAISLAVKRYSQDRPNNKVEDLVSAGGHYLDLPTGWEPTKSTLKQIEFPIGNVPPTYMEPATFGTYNTPVDQKIMLRDVLQSGDTVRVTYTIMHVVDVATETPPAEHQEAICSWAAANLCEQLAAYYSGESDSTLAVDSVDHQNKAKDFALRASSLRKRYFNELGIDPKRNVAAGVVVDLDMPNSRGRDRLQHPGRYR